MYAPDPGFMERPQRLRCVRRGKLLHGKAVQVEPIKPTLNAPGTKRLTLKPDEPLSILGSSFNLRRYTMVFNGTKYLMYPSNYYTYQNTAVNARFSDVQYVTWTEETAVLITWHGGY